MPKPSDAKDQVLTDVSVMTNVATPYLSVRFLLTTTHLSVSWPEAILGIVPIGEKQLGIALSGLRRIRLTHTVISHRLVVAAAIASLPWLIDLPRVLVAVAAGSALWLLLLSVVGVVEIVDGGDHRTVIPVCLLQRGITGDVVAAVRDAVESEQGTRP